MIEVVRSCFLKLEKISSSEFGLFFENFRKKKKILSLSTKVKKSESNVLYFPVS